MLLILSLLLRVLEILIFARVVISFVPRWANSPVGQIVIALTEPFLRPLRAVARVQGPGIGIDFSPMIVLFIIHGLRSIFHL